MNTKNFQQYVHNAKRQLTFVARPGTRRNATLSLLTQIVTSLVGAIQLVLLARFLGAEGVGMWSAIVSLVAITAGFVNFGFHVPVARDIARRPSTAQWLVGTALGVSFLVSYPLTVGVSTVVGWLTKYQGPLSFSILLAALGILLASTGILFSRTTQALNHFGWDFGIQSVARITGVVLLIGALKIYPSINSVLVVSLLISLAIIVCFYFFLQRTVGTITPKFNRGASKFLISEALPVTFASVMATIGVRADNVILERMVNPTEAGLYTVAYSFFLLGAVLLYSLTLAVFPPLARLNTDTQNQKTGSLSNEFRSFYFRVLIYFTVIGLCGTILIWFLGESILLRIFGEDFTISAKLLGILAIGLPFVAISRTSFQALNASGKQTGTFTAFATGAIFNVALNLLLIPVWGAYAASAISVTTEVIIAALTVFMVTRRKKGIPT